MCIRDSDGTCLADVDQLVKLDPGATRWAIMHRAQCSMLAGKCEAGKALMSKYFEETGQMLVEQIERSVEALASMYCTGPLDDRGELLRALTTLQKGAYQGNIGIRACSGGRRDGRRRRRRTVGARALAVARGAGRRRPAGARGAIAGPRRRDAQENDARTHPPPDDR